MIARILRIVAWSIAWLTAVGCAAWAAGALAFDLPWPALRKTSAILLLFAMVAVVLFLRGKWRKLAVIFSGFCIVLGWWLTLKPSNDRAWQPDVAQTAWVEINGDVFTFHNVRNCDYRTETDYTPKWETRTVRLSQITGLDLAVCYWGSPWMAHPIASFQFADAPPLCFSIETRKEVGENYSAIGGLYRQYELVYIVADERDVLRVRTNYRQGEDVFLYRTLARPEKARERFLEYVKTVNSMRDRARWYNALTTNCTTAIRDQHPASERIPWDWRMLVNGKGDEMMFEHRALATGGLSFEELKKRSHINVRAREADQDPAFSVRIRTGLPERIAP